MDHLVKACPAIDQLHIKFDESFSKTKMVDLFASIHFNHLKWLTIDVEKLFDGSYLPLVPNVIILN